MKTLKSLNDELNNIDELIKLKKRIAIKRDVFFKKTKTYHICTYRNLMGAMNKDYIGQFLKLDNGKAHFKLIASEEYYTIENKNSIYGASLSKVFIKNDKIESFYMDRIEYERYITDAFEIKKFPEILDKLPESYVTQIIKKSSWWERLNK